MGSRTVASRVLVAAPADAVAERDVAVGGLDRWNARYADPSGMRLVPVLTSGSDPPDGTPWHLVIGVLRRADAEDVARLARLARSQARAGRPVWLFVADDASSAVPQLVRDLGGGRPRPLVASYGSPEQLEELLRLQLAWS